MKLNKWVRQSHRWICVVFTLAVIYNFAATFGGTEPAVWVCMLALVPLFLLLLTGLYMFVQPYVSKRRAQG
ncbi:MAG: hypothetical protein RID23_03180 [Roseovarius sp.]